MWYPALYLSRGKPNQTSRCRFPPWCSRPGLQLNTLSLDSWTGLFIVLIVIKTWSEKDDPCLKPFAGSKYAQSVFLICLNEKTDWWLCLPACLPALGHVLKAHQGGLLCKNAMSRDAIANWAAISGGERSSLQWSLALPIALSSLPSMPCHAGQFTFTLLWPWSSLKRSTGRVYWWGVGCTVKFACPFNTAGPCL